MDQKVNLGKPTVYADINVFRYVAYEELKIENPEDVHFLYSSSHLDEMIRSGNTDALEGMAKLKALEITELLDTDIKPTGEMEVYSHQNIEARYDKHKEAVAGFEDIDESGIEYLLRAFGAENLNELKLTPTKLVSDIERITKILPSEQRGKIVRDARLLADVSSKNIEGQLSEHHTLTQTRDALGLDGAARDRVLRSDSPIETAWEIVKDEVGDTTIEEFFGFKQSRFNRSFPQTQKSAALSAYTMLNLLGYSADSGLNRRDKIRNSISDSQHVGIGSYCNALLSADRRFCVKASAIYKYMKNSTDVLSFKYRKGGLSISLEVSPKTK